MGTIDIKRVQQIILTPGKLKYDCEKLNLNLYI